MTLSVTVHADAATELEAAAVWYDDQREGLGLQFLAAVDRAIQHARAWPHTGAPVEGLSLMTIDDPATGRAALPARRSIRTGSRRNEPTGKRASIALRRGRPGRSSPSRDLATLATALDLEEAGFERASIM